MFLVPGPGVSREERLNHMVLTYEKELLRLCCLYLRDLSLAQDAVQETFLKAYRHLSAFRGQASERTWLTRIAVNTCKDMLKEAWTRHIDRHADLDTLPVPVAPPSVEHLALTQAILDLPPKMREVVLLHCDQGLSVKETARVLGITSPAVCNRLSKAREQLRISLKEEE